MDKVTNSASGNTMVVSSAHRRSIEYIDGVLTFEQRDMSHRVLQIRDGEAHVQRYMFVGKIDHPTLGLCRFREHIVVRDGEVLHTVDEFSCS